MEFVLSSLAREPFKDFDYVFKFAYAVQTVREVMIADKHFLEIIIKANVFMRKKAKN